LLRSDARRWPEHPSTPAYPRSVTSIHVGASDGLHTFEATSGTGFAEAVEPALGGRNVMALAADGSDLWAILDRREVWRASVGSRDTWSRVGELDALRANCVAATRAGVLVGTSEAHLRRVGDAGLELADAFDHMEGRDGWYTPWGGPPDVRSIAEDGDAVYANVHVGGIARSTDGGGSWQPTIDVDADVHEVRAHPDRPELVLAAAAVGLCRSDDAGATWTVSTEGLHATYCRAVALAGDVMLVSASTGPFTERGALYRRAIDVDGPFERCTDGLPEWQPHNIDTGCVTTDGELAIFGGAHGIVYGSEDAGRTWRVLADGLPPITAVAID
jgi:hypothetical protein